ncbi:MAG: hypothetical protein IKQ09_07105 [Bacteroidales bacterium]|nr:hypothetical protein [Bacteroidales bacterium]
MKRTLLAITLLLFFTTSCVTKSVSVSCPSSGARIVVDGDYAGSQNATVTFKNFAHVTVSAPEYLSQSFTLGRKSSSNTEVCLKRDPSTLAREYIIKTQPEDAIIERSGNPVGTGTYKVSLKRNEYDVVEVRKEGYFSSTVRIDGTDDEPGVYTVTLVEDDSWTASAPASDIANKNIRFRATTDKTDDEIWYTLIRYASDYFGDFTVNDKGAGWAKSTWVTKTFSKIKVRSRLEIKRNPGDKREFTLYLSSEYTNRKDCNDDECYKPWDRVLKTYVELPSALSTAVQ